MGMKKLDFGDTRTSNARISEFFHLGLDSCRWDGQSHLATIELRVPIHPSDKVRFFSEYLKS